MFGISLGELILVGLVTLLVLGPDKLKTLAKTGGHWLVKTRRYYLVTKQQLIQEMELTNSTSINEIKQTKQQLNEFITDVTVKPFDRSAIMYRLVITRLWLVVVGFQAVLRLVSDVL